MMIIGVVVEVVEVASNYFAFVDFDLLVVSAAVDDETHVAVEIESQNPPDVVGEICLAGDCYFLEHCSPNFVVAAAAAAVVAVIC